MFGIQYDDLVGTFRPGFIKSSFLFLFIYIAFEGSFEKLIRPKVAMFKLGILFLIGFFLTLASCDSAKTPRDKFLTTLQNEVNAGTSYRDIALKIMLKEFPNQGDPHATITEKYDFGISDEELERSENEKLQFIENIKSRNCDNIWSYLDKNRPQFEDSNYNLMGFFLEQGICFERDPAKAAEIYSNFLREEYNDPIGAARLGNLYWKGDGVEKDIDLANQYFEKAAIWQAFAIWAEKRGESFLDPKDTLGFKIWKLTPSQLSSNFTDIEIGPWDLPEPLTKRVHWIESLAVEGGSEIFEIAQHLFHGTGGYEQDKDAASYWMMSAGEFFNNQEAQYLSLIWEKDLYECTQEEKIRTTKDCEDWDFSFLFSMGQLAAGSHNKAISFMMDFYVKNLDEKWSGWALYQFLLLAQKEKLEVDEDLLVKVKNGLNHLKHKVIEAWVADDFKMPIKNFLPLENMR